MRRRTLAALALATFLAPALGSHAQYGSSTGEVLPNNYPPPLPERQGPPPTLRFELEREISLEGPVGDEEAWADGEAVIVPLADGTARVEATAGAAPHSVGPQAPPAEAEPAWIGNAEGTRRYRATPEGVVEAEKRRKPDGRWKRAWRIIAPNATPAPPILLGPRLCYAGLDDRVTCVKASNGHRLWTTDLGDRLSRPMARWPSARPERVAASSGDRTIEGEILLSVPDNGASMIALDAYDGRRLATYDLPAAARLVSGPLVLPSDGIAAVREAFDKRQIAVLVLRLVHNEPPPQPSSPSGR